MNKVRCDHCGGMMLNERCNLDNCNGYVCEFHSLLPETQEYILQLDAENAKFRNALRTIMFATTLPPDALMGDHAGFYKRELQRCIGDAARALDSQEDNAS